MIRHAVPYIIRSLPLHLHLRKPIPLVILLTLLTFPPPGGTTAGEHIPAPPSGGIRTLIIERPNTDTVTINLYIALGRINEPESGAANLLLHTLFRGSKRFPAREITREVARMGATLDYHVGYLTTLISISLPSTPFIKGGKEAFDRAITLLSDIALNPVLDADDLEDERTLILQKLAIEKDFPLNRFFKETMQRQFPGHPFGRGSEGTEDSVRKLNAELLKSYHREFYAPGNVSIVIVGDVVAEIAEARVNELFGKINKRRYGQTGLSGCKKENKIQNTAPPKLNRRILLNEPVTQAQIFVGRPVPGLNQRERHVLSVMDKALSGLHGRLFNRLRKKMGCVYSVGIWEAIYPGIGLWGVYAGTETRGLKATEHLILSELKRLIRRPIKNDELATAQLLLETAIRTRYETNNAIAHEAGASLVRGETILPMEKRIELIRSVTAEDITALANKLFGEGEFNVIIMK